MTATDNNLAGCFVVSRRAGPPQGGVTGLVARRLTSRP